MQIITRKCNFDSGHRVMNEFMKCYNIHGHTYLAECSWSHKNMEEIGYAIDFKEIKRVFLQWIDDILDHGMILNPHDTKLIETTREYGTKLWLMSLAGEGQYCNPSVENITREVFLAMEILTNVLYGNSDTGLKVYEIKIFETPNCASTCRIQSISDSERTNFYNQNYESIRAYALEKGKLEYDDRKK